MTIASSNARCPEVINILNSLRRVACKTHLSLLILNLYIYMRNFFRGPMHKIMFRTSNGPPDKGICVK